MASRIIFELPLRAASALVAPLTLISEVILCLRLAFAALLCKLNISIQTKGPFVCVYQVRSCDKDMLNTRDS